MARKLNVTRFGYTLMTEQSGPKELIRYAVGAEQAAFDSASQFVRLDDIAESISSSSWPR
jgi:hypothetical protein